MNALLRDRQAWLFSAKTFAAAIAALPAWFATCTLASRASCEMRSPRVPSSATQRSFSQRIPDRSAETSSGGIASSASSLSVEKRGQSAE